MATFDMIILLRILRQNISRLKRAFLNQYDNYWTNKTRVNQDLTYSQPDIGHRVQTIKEARLRCVSGQT